MTATTRPYRILIALDSSEYAEIVVEHALDQAARHDLVDLHFVAVVASRDRVAEAKVRLAELAFRGLDTVRGTDWRSRLHIRIGDAAEEIADLAGEIDADLLVVGRFGVHASRRRDSTADAVLELVGCPTLVVGLGTHVVDANPQCPRCAAVREESDGERWFCDEHASPDRLDLTTRLPANTTSIGGGPLW